MYSSHRPYNPSAFKLFWKPFIRVFQAICVSHYSIFYRDCHVGRFIYYIVFTTLHTALMCYALIHGLHIHIKPNGSQKESPLMYYVNFVSVTGNFVTHTIAHLEPLFTRNQEAEIYQRLNEINEIFALKLNYVIDFVAIKRKYIRRTVVFYIFSAVISFGYSFYSVPESTSGILLFLINRFFSVIIIRSRRCQVAFIINALTNSLTDLQILLKRQQKSYRATSVSSDKILYLRDIYSNVWILKNLISDCFGWTLITFLMEFSFDLINSSYWAYISFKVYDSRNKIIRKIFSLLFFKYYYSDKHV